MMGRPIVATASRSQRSPVAGSIKSATYPGWYRAPSGHHWSARQNPRMRRRLELYRFRYFDDLRRRWLLARYVLEAPAIRCKYAEASIVLS